MGKMRLEGTAKEKKEESEDFFLLLSFSLVFRVLKSMEPFFFLRLSRFFCRDNDGATFRRRPGHLRHQARPRVRWRDGEAHRGAQRCQDQVPAGGRGGEARGEEEKKTREIFDRKSRDHRSQNSTSLSEPLDLFEKTKRNENRTRPPAPLQIPSWASTTTMKTAKAATSTTTEPKEGTTGRTRRKNSTPERAPSQLLPISTLPAATAAAAAAAAPPGRRWSWSPPREARSTSSSTPSTRPRRRSTFPWRR